MGELKKSDSIIFPDQYEIIEEADTTGLHSACIKLTHQDILKFIKKNKLTLPDSLKAREVTPMTFLLLKNLPNFPTAFQLKTTYRRGGGIFADTTSDKLYLTIFY